MWTLRQPITTFQVYQNDTPERPSESTGTDGKRYPARRRTDAERQELVARLRQRGLSLRRIAELLGVHHDTIREDLSIVGNPTIENPPVVQRADGKRYPARQRTEAERQELVARLRQLGLSLRRIAELLGVDVATIYRDLSIVENATIENPPVVQRADGKRYPARQRTEVERQELVARLRQRGLSLRRIAELLGVDTKTVYNDLNSILENSKNENPDRIQRSDGKTYPSRQRTEAERQELARAAGETKKTPAGRPAGVCR